jgi:hypothetical protein
LNIEEYRVDIDREAIADVYVDAYEFVKGCKQTYDTVILDPPYSYRKSMEFYKGHYTSKFRLIADELIRFAPRVISFGYHNNFMGKKRGYELKELCVFGHGGAQHCTIGIVEEALNKDKGKPPLISRQEGGSYVLDSYKGGTEGSATGIREDFESVADNERRAGGFETEETLGAGRDSPYATHQRREIEDGG